MGGGAVPDRLEGDLDGGNLAPIPYGVLRLALPAGVDAQALPTDLQDVPAELLLTSSKHSIGRVIPSQPADGVTYHRISKPFISACHCTFELREGSEEAGAAVVVVTDSSTNGTYINHSPIGKGKAMNLLDGDMLTLYKPRDVKKPSLEYVFTQLPQGLTHDAAKARRLSHSHRIPGSPTASAVTAVTSSFHKGGPSSVVVRTSTSTSTSNNNGGGEAAALIKANAGLRDKCAQLEGELSKEVSRRKELTAQLDKAAHEKEQALAQLRQELEGSMASERSKGSEAQAQAQQTNALLKSLKDELHRANTELECVRESLRDKEALVNDLSEGKNALEHKVASLGGQLAAEKTEHKTVQTSLEKERGRVRQLSSALEETKAAKQALETQSHELSMQLSKAKDDAADLQQRLNDMETELGQSSSAATELAGLRVRMAEQAEEVERRKAEALSLEKRIRDYESRSSRTLTERAAAQQKVEALESQLTETSSALQAALEKAQAKEAEGHKMKDSLDRATEQVRELEGRVSRLEEEVGEERGQCRSLRGELAQLHERNGLLQASCGRSLASLRDLRVLFETHTSALEGQLQAIASGSDDPPPLADGGEVAMEEETHMNPSLTANECTQHEGDGSGTAAHTSQPPSSPSSRNGNGNGKSGPSPSRSMNGKRKLGQAALDPISEGRRDAALEEEEEGEGEDEETCSGITTRTGCTTLVAGEGKRRKAGEEEGEEEEGEEDGSVDLCAGVAMEGRQEAPGFGGRTLKPFTASFALHEAGSSQDSPA